MTSVAAILPVVAVIFLVWRFLVSTPHTQPARAGLTVQDAEAMRVHLPENIADLESFCAAQGLTCRVRTGPDRRSFGNIVLQYGDSRIAVSIVLDRSQWDIRVAAPTSQSSRWHDIGILRNLLTGQAQDVQQLNEEIAFLKTNWAAIVDLFSPEKLPATEASLDALSTARFKRLMPGILPD
jgi:hypothetical protein